MKYKLCMSIIPLCSALLLSACGGEAVDPTTTPAPEPTPKTTKTPKPKPSATVDPQPTAEPNPEPTQEPIPEPTLEPTPEPTLEPMPTATPKPKRTKPPQTPVPEPTPTATPKPKPSSTPMGNGLLNNFPLEQTPANGEKSVVWVRAEFDGVAFPAGTEERIRATHKTFNEYVELHSNGRLQIKDFNMSPVLTSKLNVAGVNTLDEMHRKSEAAAKDANFDTSGAYKAYVFNSQNFDSFGGVGGGDGKTGTITMGPNIWIPGVVHEMLHMFSIGHAEAIEGGDKIFPGENVGGLDPYFFMGSEEDQKDCPYGTDRCEIYATISIPHKARAGWLVDEEIVISDRDNKEHTFKLYNQDTLGRPEPKLLAAYLKGYDKGGVFVVSYIKKAKSHVITKNGVIIHYTPYQSPAVSRLLDLSPNSKKGNPVRPNETAYDMLYDFGDAAIIMGESVDVSNLFNIEVLNEGIEGADDYWAEVKISPL